jgi:thymidylate synthase ThyX
MKATLISIKPSHQAEAAGRPALTPEELSATLARHSRNGDGFDEILKLVDHANPDASVDRIFKMVDYGHRSIADMAPVAINLEGVSCWLVYLIWSFSARAGGQECSTRYIGFQNSGAVDFSLTGLPEECRGEWHAFLETAIGHYHGMTALWRAAAEACPQIMRVPEADLDQAAAGDERSIRKVERLRRNFALDRARYWIPAAMLTNVGLVMPAGAWVDLCAMLLSHPVPEAYMLGHAIRDEMRLVVPRLIKHACTSREWVESLMNEIDDDRDMLFAPDMQGVPGEILTPEISVEIDTSRCLRRLPSLLHADVAIRAFACHTNRYAPLGRDARRVFVRYGIDGVALAELRDLNRHRTGYKVAPMVPLGFYGASDEIEQHIPAAAAVAASTHARAMTFGLDAVTRQRNWLRFSSPAHVYWSLLGTQVPFEHGTTLDKMAYTIALRTGAGAHFRYAGHMRSVHARLLERMPQLDGLIGVGDRRASTILRQRFDQFKQPTSPSFQAG